MEQEDSFVAAGGLAQLTSREQLFERDVRLILASESSAFSELSSSRRACIVSEVIEHASFALLLAADDFLKRKTEVNWRIYRHELRRQNDASKTIATTANRACARAAIQSASR